VCMQKITVDRVFDEASKLYVARAAKHEILS
jgi:hypothetical protein